jgi:hypothetical protein
MDLFAIIEPRAFGAGLKALFLIEGSISLIRRKDNG